MAVVGAPSKKANSYSSAIRTMTSNVKAPYVTNEKNGNWKALDLRAMAGSTELCVAWCAKENSKGAKEFLSVEIDDPSFLAPMRAASSENAEDKATHVWNRR